MTYDSMIRNMDDVDDGTTLSELARVIDEARCITTLSELARAIDEARCIIVILPRRSASDASAPAAPIDTWRDRDIGDLELPVRTYNVLTRAGITTVGQLCRQTRRDLLRLPWSGRKTVEAIEEALAKHGLALRQE